MKTGSFSRFLPVVVASLLVGVSVHGAFEPVQILVERLTEEVAKSDGKASNQNRPVYLQVKLTNRSTSDYQSLTVRYYIFSRDVKSHDVSLEKNGTATASLKSLQSYSFKSESVTFSVKQSKQGKNRSGERSGKEYYGYGVQVLLGSTVVSEQFVPSEAKSKTGGTPPTDKAAKGQKEPSASKKSNK